MRREKESEHVSKVRDNEASTVLPASDTTAGVPEEARENVVAPGFQRPPSVTVRRSSLDSKPTCQLVTQVSDEYGSNYRRRSRMHAFWRGKGACCQGLRVPGGGKGCTHACARNGGQPCLSVQQAVTYRNSTNDRATRMGAHLLAEDVVNLNSLYGGDTTCLSVVAV